MSLTHFSLDHDFEIILKYNEYNRLGSNRFGSTAEKVVQTALIAVHGTGECSNSTISKAPNSHAILVRKLSQINNSRGCSTMPLPLGPPINRNFWKAGSYRDSLKSKSKCSSGIGYIHIPSKFLHSNATSHKWVFGAVADLLDHSVNEAKHGTTFVVIDLILNLKDESPALSIQDNGRGMDPEEMRRLISYGFSDNKSQNDIEKYGNVLKTSCMRLGADAVIFSRCKKDNRFTLSIGLLSYTFLKRTGQDIIVVPMVDYEFEPCSSKWKPLHDEQKHRNNLSILLQWSPFSTEDELLFDSIFVGPHGTKIIVYNLWYGSEGKLELDFDSDPQDIRIFGKVKNTSRTEVNDQHLANRLQYSLRAYLSILYLRAPESFSIYLRGRAVEFHEIVNDLKNTEINKYRPRHEGVNLLTTIGALKEAPAVNVHGFNVYHKNRLILPFWNVLSYGRGRGVVGVLEADFLEPTRNNQDFERTPLFQKIEARLKKITQEFWNHRCGIGYYQYPRDTTKNIPRDFTKNLIRHVGYGSIVGHCTYQKVELVENSSIAASASQYKVNGSSNHMAENRSELPLAMRAASRGKGKELAVADKRPETSLAIIHQNTERATYKEKGKGKELAVAEKRSETSLAITENMTSNGKEKELAGAEKRSETSLSNFCQNAENTPNTRGTLKRKGKEPADTGEQSVKRRSVQKRGATGSRMYSDEEVAKIIEENQMYRAKWHELRTEMEKVDVKIMQLTEGAKE